MKISTPMTGESCHQSKCELSCRQLHNNAESEHFNLIYLLKNKLLPFTISISNAKKKIIESNLAKKIKDLYTEHYKIFPNKLNSSKAKTPMLWGYKN